MKTIKNTLYYLYSALFLCLPWSYEIRFGNYTKELSFAIHHLPFKIEVPTEPLLLLCALVMGFYIWLRRAALQRLLGRPNITSPVLWWWLYWGWSVVCSFFSSMPLVSWKYVVIEGLHGWVFFGGFSLLPGLWRRVLPFFLYSMGLFVCYALVHHAFYGFRADQSLLAPMPFFPDHTLYAAVLASALPFVYVLRRELVGWLLVGLWFAYCRAAWLSLLVTGVAVWGVLGCPFVFLGRWGFQGKYLLPYPTSRFIWLGLSIVVLWVASIGVGYLPSEKIKKLQWRDASALERLNRYRCATDMANARPFFGFGPGTFQFQYIPYQRPNLRTRISVDSSAVERTPHTYGRGGGAHSEYLQALSELGWPGLVLFMIFVATALYGTANHFLQEKSILSLSIFCCLFLCFSHAAVNQFLHDARVAALVFCPLATIFVNRTVISHKKKIWSSSVL